jgi:RNase H-fold protein (predicted Holliday junction resolvase)
MKKLSCSSRVSPIYSKVNEDCRGSALFGHNLANAFNLSINVHDENLTESPAATNAENMKRGKNSMQLIYE